MTKVFTEATGVLVRPGVALIVGLASADGEPFATRGWGVAPDDAVPTAVRVLVSGDDPEAAALLTASARVAVTGADVRTLESAQMKGRIERVEAVSEADLACHDAYREAFFAAVSEVDDLPLALLERLLPSTLVACVMVVDEAYDQTPGPGAGAALRTEPS